MAQDFPVAVPAAVGGGAPASRVVSADLAEDLAFAVLPQVQLQVRVALAVARREAEPAHPVDLNEVQVKLRRGDAERVKGDTQDPPPPPGLPAVYLVVFAGVPEEVSEEVKAGAFSDQDEVSGAVGQVSGR